MDTLGANYLGGGFGAGFVQDTVFSITAQHPAIQLTSEVRTLSVACFTGVPEAPPEQAVNVYPNPASDVLTVLVNRTTSADMVIYTGTGDAVLCQRLQAGSNTVVIPPTLGAGLYFYTVDFGNGRVLNNKLVLLSR